jgi:hypothetical protein
MVAELEAIKAMREAAMDFMIEAAKANQVRTNTFFIEHPFDYFLRLCR